MRPAWQPFLSMFTGFSPDEVRQRFERGDQYLRDAGVYFRRYSGDPLDARQWPLSHVPVILDEGEWSTICDGLAQRADLLEAVMADLYGPGTLVADGHLPAELVAGNPHWLRPMVGVRPVGGHYLHFLAFEVGRSPDGNWLVLGDRTQAPSGAGFALENRMATRRIFPEPYPRSYTHRLSGFFETFRESLGRLAQAPGGVARDIGLLTPGRANDAFFEHFYIARYLGMPLLEGEDVIVEDAEAKLRTIEGPVPLGLLWRRIDSEFADPLECDPTSRIGVPGLMQAVRAGNLALVNALGSGVLEARAMMAFLPRIARVLTGAPLALPNLATWWCGGAEERAFVQANRRRMVVGPALATDLPFGQANDAGAPGDDAPGRGHVGQEAVTLSTTPRWIGDGAAGRLVPCPMTVRVFAARTADGWRFMQGGYARVGPPGDATALSMQSGGAVADVLVVSQRPVTPPSAPGGEPQSVGAAPRRRAEYAALPTRAADNLFWLGRYVSRFEDTVRLLRALHLRIATTAASGDPLLDAMTLALDALGVPADKPLPAHVIAVLDRARDCAERVRDRFSVDGWVAIDDLVRTAHDLAPRIGPGDDAARAMSVLLRKTSGVSGIVTDTMYRFSGWRFLSLGRALERADMLAHALSRFAVPGGQAGMLDIALEVGDGAMAHRRRYALHASEASVMELLALDAGNPRSLLFQVEALHDLAAALPNAAEAGRPGPVLRAILPLRSALEVAQPETLGSDALTRLRSDLAAISDAITGAYLR
ncbi:circularly permuted type 2 ATP-grasp protein [Rhodobacteraceae bacterium ASV31]|nr:circularly permuted type 2 ATP-grasp protein [Anianabacter salinae]